MSNRTPIPRKAIATKLARDIEVGEVVLGRGRYFDPSQTPCCVVGHLRSRGFFFDGGHSFVWLIEANDNGDITEVCRLLREIE